MSEWKEYKLGEVCDILNHRRIPLSSMQRKDRQGNYPYYGASGIIDNVDDYIFEGEHILISEDGENLRTRKTPIAFLANGKFWVNNHAHILKSDPMHSRLICYYFANLDINPYITGAVQPKLNQASLRNITLYLPVSEKERKKIVDTLSSLDDKIDLLNRQNKTLEGMAEALFRKWFVEEAKEEWEMGKLEDEIEIIMGQSPSGTSYNEEKKGTPLFQGNADFGFRFPTNRIYTTEPKKIAQKFDTLISVRAPVGEQNMSIDSCCIGRGVAAFRHKQDASNYYYTYYKMKSLMSEIMQFNDTGTVFGSISKSDFAKINIVVPDPKSVSIFNKEAAAYDDKIHNNTVQILTLTKLRDTLLPKLMNNEVRV